MKEIRKDLKLTQQELALLLNVSRSAIAMCEKNMRSLPSCATVAWARLQKLWQQSRVSQRAMNSIPNSFIKTQQALSMEQLIARQQRAALTTVHLTQQLSGMEKNHQKLSQQARVLKLLIQEATPGSPDWILLKNREKMALIRLAKCCPEKRQLLSYRLQVLTAKQKAALSGKVMLQQQMTVNDI